MYTKDDNGEYVQAIYTDQDTERVQIPNGAANSEIRSGEKSRIRIAIKEGLPIISQAKSWEELHNGLAKIGFEYLPKGGGAVIVGHCNDGNKYEMKASRVHRGCSFKNLQKRLGEYTPSTSTVVPRPFEPIEGISEDELKEYKEYRNDVYQEKTKLKPKNDAKLDELIKERNELIIEYERLRSENTTDKIHKLLIKAQSAYIQDKISSLSLKINTIKSIIKPQIEPTLPFNEWTHNYKHQDHFVNVTYEITSEAQSQIQIFNQIHQGIGASYYQIDAEKDGITTQIYLNSNKSRKYTANDIVSQILPHTLVTIYCTPIDIDTRYIYVKPMTQEDWDYILNLRDTRDIQPALILKNNKIYNVYYKISAPSLKNEQIIYQRLSTTLKVTIEVKPKIPLPSKKNNIEIVENSGQECSVLSDYICKLYGLMTNKRKNIDSDDEELYKAHYDDIIKQIKRKYTDDEIYEMIGVRLRATGHDRMEIVRILEQRTKKAKAICEKVLANQVISSW